MFLQWSVTVIQGNAFLWRKVNIAWLINLLLSAELLAFSHTHRYSKSDTVGSERVLMTWVRWKGLDFSLGFGVFFLAGASLFILCCWCVFGVFSLVCFCCCKYQCKWVPGKARHRNDLLLFVERRGLSSHPVGVEFSPLKQIYSPPGEGPLCKYHCRVLWQCFRSQRWKTGEPSISCQNAPDCTKLHLKFQKFSRGWHPRTPEPAEGPPVPPGRGGLTYVQGPHAT